MKKITKSKSRILLLFLFLLAPTVLSASAQDVLLNLDFTNASLSKVLTEIGHQASLSIIYNTKDVNPDQVVTIRVSQEKLSVVMTRLLKNSGASYSIRDKYLVLFTNKGETVNAVTQNKRVIKGHISDTHGEPLIGVSVLIKGTANGTITDINGDYSIEVANNNAVLEISYIGYRKISLSVANTKSFDIVMEEDTQMLNEVVVTAMGIERAAKSLTYATQKVDGKELTRAKDANFINALQGKTAGLVITPNSTGAGGSSKILLRGNASILGTNSPLIVLDGIPMADHNQGQIEGNIAYGGGHDGGDGLSNINPDDIQSITVLKGANAAALYGSRAANGVLLITTKKGYEGKVSVDVSSSSLFETPLVTPEFQDNYGAGVEYFTNGYFANGSQIINPTYSRRLTTTSWGGAIGRLSDRTLEDIPYARNSAQSNIGNFLRTGTNFNNTISITGGNAISQSYFSYGNTQAKGMMPNNTFSRHIFSFRNNFKLFKDKLELSFSANYVKQESKNKPSSGYFGNPLYNLYLMPRNADIRYFKDNQETYGALYALNSENWYTNSTGTKTPRKTGEGPIQVWPWQTEENGNSPYWTANRIINTAYLDRFYTSISAKVNIMEGLSAQARMNYDVNNVRNEGETYHGTRGKNFYNSVYYTDRQTDTQIFIDGLISYAKSIKDFDLSVNVGGSMQEINNRKLSLYYTMGDTTAIPNVYDPQNIKNPSLYKNELNKSKNWEHSVYATASVGYKQMAYVDFSVRNDWSQAFQQFVPYGTSPSYAYYALGGNVLLNDVFKFTSDKVNLLKVRLSYSQVGNSIPNVLFDELPYDFNTGGYGAKKFTRFEDPRPETVTSTELGVEGRFFNNAWNWDLTLYNSIMHNQYLTVSSATAGSRPINSGRVRNRGFEFTTNYYWMINQEWSWKTGFNISYNDNEILQTYGNDKDITIDLGQESGLKIIYRKGRPYGDLYANTIKRDQNGKIITDRYGAPVITNDCNTYIGNANSKVNFGWNNTFNYKDFSLYFLIDGKVGGKIVSLTEAKLDYYGVSKRSGDARDRGIVYMKESIVDGNIVQQAVPGIVMSDGQIASAQDYYQTTGGGLAALSEYTYDATNLRLRELSVGYTFRSLFGNGKNLSVSVVGRNLFFIYKKSPVDPDVSVSTSNGFGGIDCFSLPTTRSFGINLKASF